MTGPAYAVVVLNGFGPLHRRSNKVRVWCQGNDPAQILISVVGRQARHDTQTFQVVAFMAVGGGASPAVCHSWTQCP